MFAEPIGYDSLRFPDRPNSPGGAQDSTPPVLTAFDFTPKAIDTTSAPATVRVNLTATDDLSGFLGGVWIAFQSPSGKQEVLGYASCTPGSTTCTVSADISFPRYGEGGIWNVLRVQTADMVGNWITFFAPDLAAIGLPTQLLVTPLVVPELVFINAGGVPVGPKGKWSTVQLQALVQNIGRLPASNVRVAFDYSIDNGVTFSRIGEDKAGTLAPGTAGSAGHQWKTQPGEYLVRVTIDPDNRITEYDEKNNSGVFPLTVQ